MSKGATFSISSQLPDTLDLKGFKALDWTEVKGLVNLYAGYSLGHPTVDESKLVFDKSWFECKFEVISTNGLESKSKFYAIRQEDGSILKGFDKPNIVGWRMIDNA